MTDSVSFIATAKKLLDRPTSEADARRAISTAYYALFHHLCLHFSLIVLQPSSGRYLRAWSQAYRFIDHGPAKQRCSEARKPAVGFPSGLVIFARAFIELQERRIDADYNPLELFTEADAHALIASAENAMAAFDSAPVEAQRAFVLFIGLRSKNR